MFKTFNEDRYFIERKYHNPDEEFDPYARMAYHGTGYDEDSGLDDEEISDGLNKLYPQIKNLPHPVAKAKAVKYVLENEKLTEEQEKALLKKLLKKYMNEDLN